ncbi:MAG: LysR family transcriptional regulator [Hyphomonas sp.]
MAAPTLNELKAFLEVAEHRSFRKAADARGTSPSTLSHIMRSLETNLGVRLFNRTTRSVFLTEAGEKFLTRIGPTLRELDSAVDDLGEFRGSPSGTVRINAPEPAARLLIRDVVPVLKGRYPEISIDIKTEGRLVDIVAEGFDAGVRLGEALPQDMIAVRFGGPITFVPVAAPAYLDRAGYPQTPDDLARHECIRQRLPSGKPYRWEFARHAQEVVVDVPGTLTLDNSRLMALAAADGQGIAYVPDIVAADLVAAGRLVTLLSNWCPQLPGLFLYYPGHRQVPTGLRALIDVLRSVYAQNHKPDRS